jgi:DHA2 family multidrug resistance protein
MVLLPLWLQTQMGYTAYLAGWALMPIGIIPVFVSPLVGKYMHHFDLRMLASISFLIFSATSFWYSTFTTDVSLHQIIMPRLVQGFAVAVFFLPLVSLSLTDIPKDRISSASGVFNFIRLVAGGGIGTALFVTFWNRRADLHHQQIGESVTPFNPATDVMYHALEGLNITGDQANAVVNTLLDQQAYMVSINEIFWLTGWLYFFLVPIVWFCHPAHKGERAIVAGD